VTLCSRVPDHVHVTTAPVPERTTVRLDGSKKLSPIVTSAVPCDPTEVTVIVLEAERVTPPDVSDATITTVPGLTPTTSPVSFTNATSGFAEVKVAAPIPVSVWPPASSGVAMSRTEPPTVRVAEAGVRWRGIEGPGDVRA
jgi:hypothetical protein